MTEHDAAIRQFYTRHHDQIGDKRLNSPFWLRRYAHALIRERNARHACAGSRVLDAGSGEGATAILAAMRGASAVALDLSLSNLRVARNELDTMGLRVPLVVGDVSALPFRAAAFDLVICSHVLEHLPDPGSGLLELCRVSCRRVLVAMPTCINPAAWVLLGGGVYWKVTRRAPFALTFGLLRVLASWVRRSDGVEEGYAGRGDLPHMWRFPRAIKSLLAMHSLHIEEVEAGPLLIPYVSEYFRPARRLQTRLDRYATLPVLRWCGFGTHVLVSVPQPVAHEAS